MLQDQRPAVGPTAQGRIARLAIGLSLLALLATEQSAAEQPPIEQGPSGQAATGQAASGQAQPEPSAKQALARLQGFVGQWRGVGQIRRGSTQGAWREQCDWAWRFAGEQPELTFKIDEAKFLRLGAIRWNAASGQFEMAARGIEEGQLVRYAGELDESGKLVLESSAAPADLPARLSLRQVAGGDRLIVLYERRSGANRFLRMAEVGYTRVGSGFGKGTSFVECVVTGGVGTIAVSHQGQTYYVCCTGCKDYFDADPAGALAEYNQRKAAEQRAALERAQKESQQPEPEP